MRGGRADDRDLPPRAHSYRRAEVSGWPNEEKASLWALRDMAAAGFKLGRLKTGTPPRLDGKTSTGTSLDMQGADEIRVPFR